VLSCSKIGFDRLCETADALSLCIDVPYWFVDRLRNDGAPLATPAAEASSCDGRIPAALRSYAASGRADVDNR
jgi:hypothetical protein